MSNSDTTHTTHTSYTTHTLRTLAGVGGEGLPSRTHAHRAARGCSSGAAFEGRRFVARGLVVVQARGWSRLEGSGPGESRTVVGSPCPIPSTAATGTSSGEWFGLADGNLDQWGAAS